MNFSKYLPLIFFILGIVFSIIAFELSTSIEASFGIRIDNIDFAQDGGALGFAILSGICFACSAYLSKKD